MSAEQVFAAVDALVARLVSAGWKEREAVKDELLTYARGHNSENLRQHLDGARKGLSLELRWEIDEILEALQPPPEAPAAPPPPEPEPEPEPPADGRLRMSDLREVYADPAGNVLFTDKAGKRWFLAQPDPRTGQPMMVELPPQQVEQIKAQLRGSPYWRIGA